MARQRSTDDLTVEELRQLLIEKRRVARQDRIEAFRRHGRLVLDGPPGASGKSSSLDDYHPMADEPPAAQSLSPRRMWIDRLLFIIEIAAVFGLVFILLNGFNLLRSLNQQVSQALAQPALTPTPLINAVVLPSGHTPPNSPGGVQPNDAEIPEHLRPIVQSLANLPLPTPSPEQAVRIQIPAISVDAPVVLGDGWEQLKKGVAQHPGSSNPGKPGNVVLSAHNDVFGEIFRHLDQLKEGDSIVLFTNLRTYTYAVRQVRFLEPTQVEVMAPSRDSQVTLISCYPYLIDNKRIAVIAALQTQP